jgi:hypothetical protein
MKKIPTFLALLLSLQMLVAQEQIPDSAEMRVIKHHTREGFFRYSSYGQSLLADMHPSFVRFDAAGISNHSEWDWGQTGKNVRTHTFCTMGINLPIWSGKLKDERFSLSVAMPLSASIWLDLGEPITAPVVNTDYRIGGPAWTFTHHLNRKFVKNYSITVDPFKHESTHLGDELTLQRVSHDLPLHRVNVSYNYSEYIFTLNDPDLSYEQTHTFRAGLMILWSPRHGWYVINEADGDASLSQPRKAPWEAYFQYQYQSPLFKQFVQIVASLEVRNRALYGYPVFDWSPQDGVSYTLQKERRVFTYNVFVGVRLCHPHRRGIFSRANFGIRLYHGNNPYGQFRNHANYSQIGACVIFE